MAPAYRQPDAATCRAAASRDDPEPVFADRFPHEPACYELVPAELPGFCPENPGDPEGPGDPDGPEEPGLRAI